MVNLNCTADDCPYKTEDLPSNVALRMLEMHQQNKHTKATAVGSTTSDEIRKVENKLFTAKIRKMENKLVDIIERKLE